MTMLRRRSFLQLAAAALPSSLFVRRLRAQSSTSTQPSATPFTAPVRADEDRYDFKRVIPNGTTTFKVSSKDSRGDFFAMEHHHTKKGGPPRHLHHNEDEWFYVIEGEYIVEVGNQLHHLKAGDSVLGPREVSHAFAFVGESTGRFLITYAPAGKMEEFFDFQDKAGGRTTFVNDAKTMRAYGMELLGPPLSIS
jgi:mannose-6-phosphate isomerase-like protein (cupin superfamily)